MGHFQKNGSGNFEISNGPPDMVVARHLLGKASPRLTQSTYRLRPLMLPFLTRTAFEQPRLPIGELRCAISFSDSIAISSVGLY